MPSDEEPDDGKSQPPKWSQWRSALLSLVKRPGESNAEWTRKKTILSTCTPLPVMLYLSYMICKDLVRWQEAGGGDASPSHSDDIRPLTMGQIGTIMFPFLITWILVSIIKTKRLPQHATEVFFIIGCAGILLIDWGTAAKTDNGGEVWPWTVVIMDALLIINASQRSTLGTLSMINLWLLVKSVEDCVRIGVYDFPYGTGMPPPAIGIRNFPNQLVQRIVPFILDFHITRRFRDDVRGSILLAEDVAQALARYDLDAADTALSSAAAERLPPELRGAYRDLIRNLSSFRPFLPDALFTAIRDRGLRSHRTRPRDRARGSPRRRRSNNKGAAQAAADATHRYPADGAGLGVPSLLHDAGALDHSPTDRSGDAGIKMPLKLGGDLNGRLTLCVEHGDGSPGGKTAKTSATQEQVASPFSRLPRRPQSGGASGDSAADFSESQETAAESEQSDDLEASRAESSLSRRTSRRGSRFSRGSSVQQGGGSSPAKQLGLMQLGLSRRTVVQMCVTLAPLDWADALAATEAEQTVARWLDAVWAAARPHRATVLGVRGQMATLVWGTMVRAAVTSSSLKAVECAEAALRPLRDAPGAPGGGVRPYAGIVAAAAHVGNAGSQEVREHAVIGGAPALARALATFAVYAGAPTVCDRTTSQNVENDWEVRQVDRWQVQRGADATKAPGGGAGADASPKPQNGDASPASSPGRKERKPLDVYEVLRRHAAVENDEWMYQLEAKGKAGAAALADYNDGVRLLFARKRPAEAFDAFRRHVRTHPTDVAAQRLLDAAAAATGSPRSGAAGHQRKVWPEAHWQCHKPSARAHRAHSVNEFEFEKDDGRRRSGPAGTRRRAGSAGGRYSNVSDVYDSPNVGRETVGPVKRSSQICIGFVDGGPRRESVRLAAAQADLPASLTSSPAASLRNEFAGCSTITEAVVVASPEALHRELFGGDLG